MIFYKKPKIYKNGNVRHGIVIIDGVQYTAEFVEKKTLTDEDFPVEILSRGANLSNFEEQIKRQGFIKIRYKEFDELLLKLTKIE